MECKECNRLKQGIYAVVAALVNKSQESALKLAKTVMYGGSVNNLLDIENPKRHLTSGSARRADNGPKLTQGDYPGGVLPPNF